MNIVKKYCSRFKKDVDLTLNYKQIDTDQQDEVKKVLTYFDCQEKEKCGISQTKPDGSIDFNWDLCPLHPSNKAK
jgi:hypothetical protein